VVIDLRKGSILAVLRELAAVGTPNGMTAIEVSQKMGIQRHNASADLNELCREGLVVKSKGRPVRFWASKSQNAESAQSGKITPSQAEDFQGLIGTDGSLKKAVEKAKASIMYPPSGLSTLITGPTGVGKSYLAEAMYKYAVKTGRLRREAPFNIFNCADYASNPQLLLSQLFGHTKGAFTGADKENSGIVAKAQGGILFLDEVHRLPPEGQEILFLLMDKGIYRTLGDSNTVKDASIRIIAATSEDPKSVLLKTFLRRFPVMLSLPSLGNRPQNERLALIEHFLNEEASRIGVTICVSPLALAGLLAFKTTGNIGELRSVIQLACAKAFLNYISSCSPNSVIHLYITDMSAQVQLAYFSGNELIRQAETLIGLDDRLYLHASDLSLITNQLEEQVPYSTIKARIDGYLKSGLKQYEIQQLIDTEIKYYIQRLVRFQEKKSGNQVLNIIKNSVDMFVKSVGKELKYEFEEEVVDCLCLYFVSSQIYNTYTDFDSMTLISYCRKEYIIVKQFIKTLEEGMERTLLTDEIIFISMFLSSYEKRKIRKSAIQIVVICHGNNTASSMAEVANCLIGYDKIIAIDMPLEESVEKTFEKTLENIKKAGMSSGVLLLVDMGSLTSFKPLLKKAVNVQVEVIPLVTTVAVIEAARLAGEADMTMDKMAQSIRKIYKVEDCSQIETGGKQVVITTCLTGKGTARRLVSFLQEGLPYELRQKIIIQAVDIENGSEVSGLMIDAWRGSIVAAVGTIDPHLPKVKFIGIEEILFGDGIKKFHSILASNNTKDEYEKVEVNKKEAINLASRFIEESAISGNSDQATEASVEVLEQLELWLKTPCSPSQAARFIIHFAFMLERLSTDGPVCTCSKISYLKENHAGLLENIRQAINSVEQQWGIDIPDSEICFLAQILLSL
jgi:transcriptional regulator with AAA-type ATPase domain/transcriptional regulatory protein LevR